MKCPRCGFDNSPGSKFCGNCGSVIEALQVATYSTPREKSSAAWWLMPIFLAWLGGLLAWVVLRESDRSKANKLFWTGIGLTVFWITLSFVLSSSLFS